MTLLVIVNDSLGELFSHQQRLTKSSMEIKSLSKTALLCSIEWRGDQGKED